MLVREELRIAYELIDNLAELAEEEQKLLQEAYSAAENAYAPYSKFHVGCAVLLKNGEIFTGNNQENAAYPSGLCAERVALFHIGSINRHREIQSIAVRAFSKDFKMNQPVMPCGSCRQVMVEYEQVAGRQFTVITQGENGKIFRITGVSGNLLPFIFDSI